MKKRREFSSSFIGATMPVLFEHEVTKGVATGLTTNYLRVEAPSDIPLTNQVRLVTLSGLEDEHCTGRIQQTEKVESDAEFVYDYTAL